MGADVVVHIFLEAHQPLVCEWGFPTRGSWPGNGSSDTTALSRFSYTFYGKKFEIVRFSLKFPLFQYLIGIYSEFYAERAYGVDILEIHVGKHVGEATQCGCAASIRLLERVTILSKQLYWLGLEEDLSELDWAARIKNWRICIWIRQNAKWWFVYFVSRKHASEYDRTLA